MSSTPTSIKSEEKTQEIIPHDDSGYASSDLYDPLPDAQEQNPQTFVQRHNLVGEQNDILRDILREMKKIKSCICKKEKKMPMRAKPIPAELRAAMYAGGRKTRRKRKRKTRKRGKSKRKTRKRKIKR
jgi:hypothetical protein